MMTGRARADRVENRAPCEPQSHREQHETAQENATTESSRDTAANTGTIHGVGFVCTSLSRRISVRPFAALGTNIKSSRGSPPPESHPWLSFINVVNLRTALSRYF